MKNNEQFETATNREARNRLQSIVMDLALGSGELANRFQQCFRETLHERSKIEVLNLFTNYDGELRTFSKIARHVEGMGSLYLKLCESSPNDEEEKKKAEKEQKKRTAPK